MDWKLMNDPANPENKNAGNGGDLVKHTVYLATLRYLLAHKPWSDGLRLRECHAGRGIYGVPVGSRKVLSCLHSNPAAKEHPVLLQTAQRDIMGTMGCWPDALEEPNWYAGSALINAFTLADNHPSLHSVDLYEWEPDTRQILRSVLTAAQPGMRSSWSVLPEEDEGREFDGEVYIEQRISGWAKQDVVLLDPFAMWREKKDQSKRNRYGAIVDGLIRHGADATSLILFWTWGNAFPVARGDLNGTNEPVKNGYHELRSRLHLKEFRFVRVKWCWGLQFAMWVVAPREHLEALRHDIDLHCGLLSNHLERRRCRFKDQRVEVAID
jgi:hypothetical protein